MEMHQLRYFLAVASEGNFTRAAEKCFVSQPSLSSQIIKLEDELGQKLFSRLGRRVELTNAGQLFQVRAQSILMHVEDAKREIQESADEVKGTLRVGTTPSVGPYLLPPLIAFCRSRYPNLEFEIVESLRGQLLEDLDKGRLEVVVSSYPGGMVNIAAEPILQESLSLVVPTGHPLASQHRISIQDFKDEPIVLLGESNTLGEKVFDFFGSNDFEPKVVAHCSQVKTVLALVHHNVGLAILPEMAQDDSNRYDIVLRSLVSERMSRLLFALTHSKRYLSPGGRAFIDTMREYIDMFY